jgi:hypothetical protein
MRAERREIPMKTTSSSASTTRARTVREALLEDGFLIFPEILTGYEVRALQETSNRLLAACAPGERERVRFQGSNIPIGFREKAFAGLIAHPRSLRAFAELGYDRPKFRSGYMLSKPPGAPPLYWHQDWAYWDDPVSAEPDPPQVFLMYYLTDTTPENGCLRAIPGSHRKRHPLHDRLPDAHTDATYGAKGTEPMFERQPDEVDIRVRAGDLVIGDARVLHAAHGNRSGAERTCLVLWYFPHWDALPEPIRAAYARDDKGFQPLTEEDAKRYGHLVPRYEGSAQPCAWNRKPGKHLA